jgi:hypothetical protein
MRPRRPVVIVLVLGLMLWFAGGGEAVAGKAKPKGKGTVVVRADVEKAVVYQGKKKLGTTPLTVKLKPGKVTLTVKKVGQKDATVEVVVVAGQEVEAFARVTTVPALRTRALRARCDAGDLDGCHELADELGEARASPLVAEIVGMACARGNPGACTHQAQDAWGAGDRSGDATAESQLSASCDAGDVSACGYLGATLLSVEESKRNPRRAVELLLLLAAGELSDDATPATELLRASCERGGLDSCVVLGNHYGSKRGGMKLEESDKWYARACDGGRADICEAVEASKKK